jgi:hypothetical protein
MNGPETRDDGSGHEDDARVPIEQVIPPDDSGRDAFERFRYQAQVAFPVCVNCAVGHDVLAVTCEHIEDVCIEETARVRFCQIKTRNSDYGLWRLADLCGASGALRSLVRTHRALVDLHEEREVVYEMWLEGALKREDLIRRLPPGGPGTNDEVARAVVKHMKPHTELRLKEARAVLARTRVLLVPPREAVSALNVQILAKLAGGLPADELREIYERSLELICQAMSGTQVPGWPAVLFAAEQRESQSVGLLAKRLESEALRERLEPALTGATPTLTVITDPEALAASAMEFKLRAAGAPDGLVEQAKSLRANATRREIELLAQDSRSDVDGKLEDLNERLLMAANVSIGLLGEGASPAPAVFADVLDRLSANPQTYDPGRLYRQDAALLMGGVCELSDRCRHAWRSDA